MTMLKCSWARGITDAVIMQFSPLSLRGALCDEAISHRVAAESRDCFAALAMTASHVAVFAEQLHPTAFVLRAAGALGYRGASQLLDDLVHGLGRGLDRERAGGTAQAPVAGPVSLVKVEVDDRDVLGADVFPDVDLRPVEQGMDPDVRALGEGGLELIPQLRGLLPEVPVAVFVPWREVAFLGARPFLVGPDAQDDAGVAFLRDQVLEPVGLEGGAAGDAAHGVVHPLGQGLLVHADDQVEPPFAGDPVPVLDHGRDLVARVDVDHRKGDMAEARLSGQPYEGSAVLAHGPPHRQAVEGL